MSVSLKYKTRVDDLGRNLYCFMISSSNDQSPTLRVNPGDRILMTLYNGLPRDSSTEMTMPSCSGGLVSGPSNLSAIYHSVQTKLSLIIVKTIRQVKPPFTSTKSVLPQHFINILRTCSSVTLQSNPASYAVSKSATNVHFHGLHSSPDCRGDNVIQTFINPGTI